MTNKLLTPEQVAARLELQPDAVISLIRRGLIPNRYVFRPHYRCWRIRPEYFTEFLGIK